MINVEVTARGEVSERARQLAREKVGSLDAVVKGPVLAARVVLTEAGNRRIPDPSRAEAEIDLQGRLIRARAAAPSMEAAVDAVADRLHQNLRRYVERLITRAREPAERSVGEWTHRSRYELPALTVASDNEEPEIVRRKSFVSGPISVGHAADALEDLDHEFLLFADVDSGADAVLYWRDDGLLAVIEPPGVQARQEPGVQVEREPGVQAERERGPIRERNRFSGPITLEAALGEMRLVNHRFLFFENAANGRGNVIYRRYDGDFGLIELA
jgi:ribosome-associated translation inhibitor RaiA